MTERQKKAITQMEKIAISIIEKDSKLMEMMANC